MNEENPWKTLSSKIVHKSKWMTIQQDKVIRPDGKKGIYDVVKSGNSVCIVALNRNQEVLLIGQFRYPTKLYSWEVPAGAGDGEDILVAAKRELQEETGLIASNWKNIGWVQEISGVSDGIANIFIATGLQKAQSDKKLEEGINQMKWVGFKEIIKLIQDSKITDATTIAVLLKAFLYVQFN